MTLAQQCEKFYPCTIAKSDTVINYSTYTDTIIVSRASFEATKNMPSKEIKSLEIGNDSLMIIRITNTVERKIKETIKDSSQLQVYKDLVSALERRILSNDKEIGTQKLTINNLKGGKRAYLVISIIEGLLLALIALFFGYVWRHNKK
jgi:hypothetical protein